MAALTGDLKDTNTGTSTEKYFIFTLEQDKELTDGKS